MADEKILVVDDEPSNLALLNAILSQEYELVFARSGRDALAAVQKHHPTMILLDVQMPDMDGYEVCRRLKENPSTEPIPIIFITALSDEIDETKGFEIGAVDYITKPISLPVVKARVRSHLSLVQAKELERSQRDALHMLGVAGHYNDNDTGVHLWRMAGYARALAEAAGWSQQRVQLMELAAPMHDTGKIGIPDAILKKREKLSPDEWNIMKTHPIIGYEILQQSDSTVFQLAAEIALRHHERWDGSGYPHGLLGIEIPESARIVAVADVFDALSMRRPYKEPWPIEDILSLMKDQSGKHFDPNMIELLEENLTKILQIKAEWDLREKMARPWVLH